MANSQRDRFDPYEAVKEFHREFKSHIGSKPEVPNKDIIDLRLALMEEELDELTRALYKRDLLGVADGLADLLYVVYGTAVSCGIDIRDIFEEVHRSNLSKIGGGKREDGKVLKGSSYDPPHLEELLRKQGWTE